MCWKFYCSFEFTAVLVVELVVSVTRVFVIWMLEFPLFKMRFVLRRNSAFASLIEFLARLHASANVGFFGILFWTIDYLLHANCWHQFFFILFFDLWSGRSTRFTNFTLFRFFQKKQHIKALGFIDGLKNRKQLKPFELIDFYFVSMIFFK